jgi:hypothetical protein
VGLTDTDREAVVGFMVARLHTQYDMRNVVDLARYLLPTPPVPTRWRRRMIALGSGEPTRSICSTLIARAFQHVRYPILPRLERLVTEERISQFQCQEILHIRHHSLYTPADFDLSPYFKVVKPTIQEGFDYKGLRWATEAAIGRECDSSASLAGPATATVQPVTGHGDCRRSRSL